MRGNDAIRGASVLGCALLTACCAGCIGSGLEAERPSGTSLAGTWKLDPAASDDPQKVIDHMRAEAKARIARMSDAPPPPEQQGPGRPGSHGAAGGYSADQPEAYDSGVAPGSGPPRDPLRNSAMYHVLADELARGDYLKVGESPGEFVLDYGTSARSFTPGAHSVVSAEGGVGDQMSGWDKGEYVIRVRAQRGPDVVESFSLSSDGKHLIEKLKIGPAELAQVNLTRVYNHTTEQPPHQLPTDD
jgi:hypothetical protein